MAASNLGTGWKASHLQGLSDEAFTAR